MLPPRRARGARVRPDGRAGDPHRVRALSSRTSRKAATRCASGSRVRGSRWSPRQSRSARATAGSGRLGGPARQAARRARASACGAQRVAGGFDAHHESVRLPAVYAAVEAWWLRASRPCSGAHIPAVVGASSVPGIAGTRLRHRDCGDPVGERCRAAQRAVAARRPPVSPRQMRASARTGPGRDAPVGQWQRRARSRAGQCVRREAPHREVRSLMLRGASGHADPRRVHPSLSPT